MKQWPSSLTPYSMTRIVFGMAEEACRLRLARKAAAQLARLVPVRVPQDLHRDVAPEELLPGEPYVASGAGPDARLEAILAELAGREDLSPRAPGHVTPRRADRDTAHDQTEGVDERPDSAGSEPGFGNLPIAERADEDGRRQDQHREGRDEKGARPARREERGAHERDDHLSRGRR